MTKTTVIENEYGDKDDRDDDADDTKSEDCSVLAATKLASFRATDVSHPAARIRFEGYLPSRSEERV